MNVLIIGYGRAGKRHGQILDKLGIDWAFYDPFLLRVPINTKFVPALYEQNLSWIPKFEFDFVVIATPPDTHLDLIQKCLDQGVNRILCEKPLCGLGQLEQARQLAEVAGDRVSVAYNWRWHPDYVRIKNGYTKRDGSTIWSLRSEMYRPDLPEWGLLLDHVSHSVDLLRWFSEEELRIEDIEYSEQFGLRWFFNGRLTNNNSFEIMETIKTKGYVPRSLSFITPFTLIYPDLSPQALDQMFLNMWGDVLKWIEDGPCPVPMGEALKTQEILEQAWEMAIV